MAQYPCLKNKRVLITGGATGIGEFMVRGFAAQGSEVHFLDMQRAAGEALAQQTGARYTGCDLTDTLALQALLSRLQADGGFDAIVNNAARDDRHDIQAVTPEQWDAIVAVNLKHYYFVSQALFEGMKARGGGAIVNVSSVTAFTGQADLPVYATAKGGCISLTRTQSRNWGAHRIRVNTIVPGWIRTQRQVDKWITPELEAAQMLKQTLPDWVQPQDVANMAVFLASDEARMCTGQVFTVDAGWL